MFVLQATNFTDWHCNVQQSPLSFNVTSFNRCNIVIILNFILKILQFTKSSHTTSYDTTVEKTVVANIREKKLHNDHKWITTYI